MGLRETIQQKPAIGYAVGGAFVVVAAVVMATMYWPERQADLTQALYTVDDGKTWFRESATKVAPFQHDGKPAMVARVYSYADGNKQFCAYVAKFTPEAKARLEAAIADAARQNKPAGSVALFNDRAFVQTGLLVKKPGADKPWISYGDPKANDIFSIKAPDGSVVDEVMP